MMILKIFFIALFLFSLSPIQAGAKEKLNFENFQTLPIQHDGRIKPISTFSRNFLYALSGYESLSSMGSDEWLAEVLFDPANALQRPVFRIFRPDILGMEKREKPYYNFAEVAQALQKKTDVLSALSSKDPQTLTKDQTELLHINEMAGAYLQILRTFSFMLPLNIRLPDELVNKWGVSSEKDFTLLDYKRIEERVTKDVQNIIKKKGKDPTKYSPQELAITAFSFEMKMLEHSGDNNILFRITPGVDTSKNAQWYSPWSLIDTGQATPQSNAYIKIWQDMARAYLSQDATAWDTAVGQAKQVSNNFNGVKHLSLEVTYNILHPLSLSLFSALIGFLCSITYMATNKQYWRIGGSLAMGLCGTFLTVAIGMRMIILSRPPVGTLYESIIFVAMLAVLACCFLEYKRRDGNGLLTGSLSALILLFTAQSFAHDDTLKMLGAVLNTNFWLATHVLCITAGYAWCLIVSILAHIWLVKNALYKNADALIRPIKILMILSLLFTSIGTILGGIWADQSWGRFWGWDPKENGALLIVLWIIWILHGQISGHVNKIWAMASMAALSIIVSLAWFGVNLLNVGLHSYGFISGIASGLFAFITFELMVIGFLVWRNIIIQKTS